MSNLTQPSPKINVLTPEQSRETALSYVVTNPERVIFPIKSGSKFPPLIKDNLTLATNDPAQIEKWAKRFPGCNWGVSCAKSGLLVIDVDIKPGKGGDKTFSDLDIDYGFPETETVSTPSGGFHKYYVGEHRFSIGTNGFGTGIDTPNYVVMPGSSFADGTSYVLTDDRPAAPTEQWFYDVITAAKKERIENAQEAVIELDQPVMTAWAKDFLIKDADPSIAGKGGNITTYRVAASLKDNGISEAKAIELMDQYYNVPGACDPEWDYDELVVIIKNAFSYGSRDKAGGKSVEAEFSDMDIEADAASVPDSIMGNPAKKKDKPRIIIDMAKLPQIVRKVQRLLIKDGKRKETAASDQIFQRSGSLAHISRNRLKPDAEKDCDKRYHVENDVVLLPVDPPWFADRCERSLEFGRIGKKKGDSGKSESRFVAQPCPKVITDRLLAIKQDWDYPELAGIVETPTLRADGSILSEPGYDATSGLYFDPGQTAFPKSIDKPTRDDAMAALARIEEVLKDFPFADDDTVKGNTVSHSVALALLLTSVCRRLLPIAPMFGIDANLAQSGKTELAQVAAIIATGRETACRPLGADEYQRQTSLAAAFEAGDAVILFDNIDGNRQNIEGDGLCMATTAPTFKMRRLGGNSAADQVSAPTNSLLIATGNKLTFAGDMTEDRALIINLRPDKPLAQRKFSHRPLSEYVLENRPQIVMDLLTILRAYHLAKDKTPGPTFRFNDFRAKIADAIVWLGLPDPIQSTQRVKDEDPISESQREVMQAWVSHFGDKPTTVRQAIENGDVLKAIADARGLDPRRVTSVVAGLYLRGMVGVTLSGYRMARAKDPTRSSAYHAVLIDGATPIAPAPSPDQGDDEADFGYADDARDEFAVEDDLGLGL